jgi:hypothetical protein
VTVFREPAPAAASSEQMALPWQGGRAAAGCWTVSGAAWAKAVRDLLLSISVISYTFRQTRSRLRKQFTKKCVDSRVTATREQSNLQVSNTANRRGMPL